MPIQKFFYPRIAYNAVNLDCDDPVSVIILAPETVRGDNVSTDGTHEALWERLEHRLQLGFQHLTTAKLAELWTWWSTWAAKGQQSAITLDRLNTCAGQWEYDQFNTAFSKAVSLDRAFQPGRSVLSQARYAIALTFRQAT